LVPSVSLKDRTSSLGKNSYSTLWGSAYFGGERKKGKNPSKRALKEGKILSNVSGRFLLSKR